MNKAPSKILKLFTFCLYTSLFVTSLVSVDSIKAKSNFVEKEILIATLTEKTFPIIINTDDEINAAEISIDSNNLEIIEISALNDWTLVVSPTVIDNKTEFALAKLGSTDTGRIMIANVKVKSSVINNSLKLSGSVVAVNKNSEVQSLNGNDEVTNSTVSQVNNQSIVSSNNAILGVALGFVLTCVIVVSAIFIIHKTRNKK